MSEILQDDNVNFIKDIEKYETEFECRKRYKNDYNVFTTLCRINGDVIIQDL